MALNKEEIMFQIEILYDFSDDEKDRDGFVASKISSNFGIPVNEARKYVDEYKALNK
jgi:hypothetical protein